MADRGTAPLTQPASGKPPLGQRVRAYLASWVEGPPTFWNALTPALALAALCFVRSPLSNYIFDEQEALLANPFVNGKELGWLDVVRRDFWGLPPERSIGSYRPIPNLLWRLLWQIKGVGTSPWLHHWSNVVLHAANAALLASFVWRVTRRREQAWLTGAAFLLSAVLTEAVTGVVGIADVLGGLGILLALHALRLPLWAMPLGVFGGLLLSLGSKESGLVGVPLVALAALLLGPSLHHRPWRTLRALVALTVALGAFIGYVEFRKHFFPVSLPAELTAELPAGASSLARAKHDFLRWFAQPRLPSDPINNPLILADTPHRIGGALRVYASGLGQVLLPLRLSGDYSFPQEPIPAHPVSVGSVLGALGMLVPPLVALGSWARALWLERRGSAARATALSLLALGLLWFPIAYFPHSNIPVLLPTVRAERFWYLPVIGTALVLGHGFDALRRSGRWRRLAVGLPVVFFGFQGLRARVQALAYTDDLTFWYATQLMAPRSAKAALNYGVMVGARGRLPERLVAGGRALELAPDWPMANIYQGDTLCRLHRPEEAWPHYVRGFKLAPNDLNLIALALQCLWDEKAIPAHEQELLALRDEYPDTWLAYLARDIVDNGERHHGVDPQYRPRSYNEGPKK